MEKNECITKKLGKGEVSVYDFGEARLHAYKTNDPIDDEVFIVEKDGKGFVIELAPFFDNIEELTGYIADNGIEIVGIIPPYHMAGATFLPGTPIYSTKEADEYGHAGGGKALIDNFTVAFGDSFDSSIPDVTDYIEGDELALAGIPMRIVRNQDAFDIEIPAINSVYTHMLGHDCHSIVAGAGHADAIVAQLEGYLAGGFDLVLTSHYTPEDLKDVQTKIDYLKELTRIAAECDSKDAFVAAVGEAFPGYSGQNYLDMTAGFFFTE